MTYSHAHAAKTFKTPPLVFDQSLIEPTMEIKMRRLLRSILPSPIYSGLKAIKYRIEYGNADHREIFRKIHDGNKWRNDESVSGSGSTVEITAVLREELASFVRMNGIRSFVDLPCGDFNWMRYTDFPDDMTYLGLDVVDSLVAKTQARYGAPGRSFGCCDILTSDLPEADAYFCKDIFIHFPNTAIEQAISRCMMKCHYFMTTTFPNTKVNIDIKFGDARRVNIALLRGEPIHMLRDFGGGVTDRYIGVWRGELPLAD